MNRPPCCIQQKAAAYHSLRLFLFPTGIDLISARPEAVLNIFCSGRREFFSSLPELFTAETAANIIDTENVSFILKLRIKTGPEVYQESKCNCPSSKQPIPPKNLRACQRKFRFLFVICLHLADLKIQSHRYRRVHEATDEYP